jgi:hypothetical protein
MNMDTKDIQKVQQFLTYTKSATRLEICGGTGLGRSTVEAILAAVVEGGLVTKTGEDNVAVYANVSQAPVAKPAPIDPRSPEQIWSDEQRKAGLEQYRREHPNETYVPPARYEPSEEEVQAAIAAKKVTPLSPEDHADLEQRLRNRTPRNPQQFVK